MNKGNKEIKMLSHREFLPIFLQVSEDVLKDKDSEERNILPTPLEQGRILTAFLTTCEMLKRTPEQVQESLNVHKELHSKEELETIAYFLDQYDCHNEE